MRAPRKWMAVVDTAVVGAGLLGLAVVGSSWPPDTTGTQCPDVDVAFARGSGESAGLGAVGTAFTETLLDVTHGRSIDVYAMPTVKDPRNKIECSERVQPSPVTAETGSPGQPQDRGLTLRTRLERESASPAPGPHPTLDPHRLKPCRSGGLRGVPTTGSRSGSHSRHEAADRAGPSRTPHPL